MKAIRKLKSKRLVPIFFSFLTLALIGVGAILITVFFIGAPLIQTEQNTVIYSADNEVIGIEQGVENREWKDLEDISQKVIDATILIEDQHFYDHYGFDFKRISAAIWKNITTLSLSEGASTITQQLARNLYLTHEKTWNRKWKEAFYALRLEMHYSKDEILEAYLNTIFYGHGAYGIQAASMYYFDKDQHELSYAEAAMLSGIPKGPSYYSPFFNEENAESRKQMILDLLRQEKIIDDATYQLASQEDLQYVGNQTKPEIKQAPHFQDMVIAETATLLNLPEERVRSSGLQIYTTLKSDLQQTLEQTIQTTIPSTTELETAVVTMDSSTGAILALSGGRDYENSVFNRATDAMRMPGSSFKPFLYYAALENGYTALTELESRPTRFELDNGEIYEPSNFNDYYAYEPIPLAQAIALSDNVYAVQTNLSLGEEKLVETAKEFGFESDLPAVPSLALGTAAISLDSIVTGYSMLANGGKEIDAYTVDKIVDWNGDVLYQREETSPRQVLDEQATFILTHLLTGMFNSNLNGYMPVTGTSISDRLSRIYAGKSGTTQADYWMLGYSPSMVTGVWTGYDDHRSMDTTQESNYAKEIWSDIMEYAHADKPQEQFKVPSGVIGVPIDVESGLRAAPECSGSHVMMYFVQGTEPNAYCDPSEQKPSEDDNGIFQKWFQLFFGG